MGVRAVISVSQDIGVGDFRAGAAPEEFELGLACRAETIEANRVGRCVDLPEDESFEFLYFARIEPGLEDAVLDAVAEVFEGFGQFRAAAVVGNIVGNDGERFHGSASKVEGVDGVDGFDKADGVDKVDGVDGLGAVDVVDGPLRMKLW